MNQNGIENVYQTYFIGVWSLHVGYFTYPSSFIGFFQDSSIEGEEVLFVCCSYGYFAAFDWFFYSEGFDGSGGFGIPEELLFDSSGLLVTFYDSLVLFS